MCVYNDNKIQNGVGSVDICAKAVPWISSGQNSLEGELVEDFFAKYLKLSYLGQWYLHQDNASVHNSILIANYLKEMSTNAVPHLPFLAVHTLHPVTFGCT